MGSNTRKYILAGLMTAMVFILTFTLKIPVPFTSGYIHLGDSMIYISVMVLGPFLGAFASGAGSMLADIIGGFPQYALPTLIIKSLMALFMGLILTCKTKKSSIISVISAIAVWSGFTAGTFFYLQDQVKKHGQAKLIEGVANTTAATIENTTATYTNLPYYLTVGIAAAIIILAVSVYFISKREGGRIFTIKAITGMVAAGMCMVMGYFLVESFMYSPLTAIFSIPMNIIQFFGGVAAASLLAPAVKKAASIVRK